MHTVALESDGKYRIFNHRMLDISIGRYDYIIIESYDFEKQRKQDPYKYRDISDEDLIVLCLSKLRNVVAITGYIYFVDTMEDLQKVLNGITCDSKVADQRVIARLMFTGPNRRRAILEELHPEIDHRLATTISSALYRLQDMKELSEISIS